MRVVLDSNVLLSALISPRGSPHRVWRAWQMRQLELVTCPTQIEEIRRASRCPKLRAILQPHRVGAMVNAISAGARSNPSLAGYDAEDPHDIWLLALADAAGADWLVTGDRRSGLLARQRIGRARIVTAAVFCDRVLDSR